jgi:hypothetical protein
MSNKGPNPKSQGRGLIIIGHWRLSFTPGQRYSVGPDFRATIRFVAERRQDKQLLLCGKEAGSAEPEDVPHQAWATPVAAPLPPLSVFREGWGEGDSERRTITDKPDPAVFRFRCPLMRRGATVF